MRIKPIVKWVSICLLSILCYQSPAFATLDLVLTQGISGAQPIAIVPFSGQDDPQAPDNVASVVSNDLRNSGRFKVLDSSSLPDMPHSSAGVDYPTWKKAGADSLAVGSVQNIGNDRYKVSFQLLDVLATNPNADRNLLSQSFEVKGADLRRLGHHIADLIYQQLTGVKGVFSTRIAYVLVQRKPGQATKYILQVADADGYNPRPILTSREPIMSPAWSHSGNQLAYVSFENRRAQIYVANVATGERKLVTSFPGINGAPAWSPDDQRLALVLSKDGSPNIYSVSINGGGLQQLTSGGGIKTEPHWSSDGKKLLFTSDRGGSPQIYQLNLADGQQKRITFAGDYNARASYTPDGQSIVFLHRQKGSAYNIALQDIETGNMRTLTNSGRDESPSIAPNGSMVLYGNEYGKLGMVSTDGRVKIGLPTNEGDVQEPAWSPFLR